MCLLKTAVATVKANDTRALANILFDEGAQKSFITQALVNQLKSTCYCKEHMCISSFGDETTPKSQVDVIYQLFLRLTWVIIGVGKGGHRGQGPPSLWKIVI